MEKEERNTMANAQRLCRECIKEKGELPGCICNEGEWWHYSRLTGCCKRVIASSNKRETINDIMANMDKVRDIIKGMEAARSPGRIIEGGT